MGKIDETIKTQIDLLEYAQKLYWNYKLNSWKYFFHSWLEDKTASLVVFKNYLKDWYYDFSKKAGGSVIDMCKNYYWIETKEAIKKLVEEYWIQDTWTFEKRETVKRSEIFEKLQSWQFFHSDLNIQFSQFLQKRWFSFQFIQDNLETLWELAKEFWTVENAVIDKQWEKYTWGDLIVFPCYHYDEETFTKTIVWAKLRRVDNEKISWVKSLTLQGTKTGLIYSKKIFESDQVIIVEWECDYIVLRALGFENVIWNLWGVASNMQEIRKITKHTNSFVSFYDNDKAWKTANKELEKILWRPIREIQYKKIEWKDKYDVNDLFIMWYNKKDFDSLIENSKLRTEEVIEEEDEEIVKVKSNWYYFIEKVKDNMYEVRGTNFLIEIEDIVLYSDDNGDQSKSLRLKLTNWIKTVSWEFFSRQTTDMKSFNSKVRSLETSFSCYDMRQMHLEALMRYIHKNVNIKNTVVVKHKGYIPEYNCWIFKNGVFHGWAFHEYNESNVVDIWEVKIKVLSWETNLPYYQEDSYYDENVKNDIIKDFRYMFCWYWGDLVLWFLVASLFVNNLKKELKPFPILFVNWKKGSWKTTAVDFALRTLWLEVSAENFETSTDFVDQLDISEISSLPLWRDEYKNVQKVKRKDWYIKSVFDRNWLSKGTVKGNSLTKNTYPINATLLLSWEESPSDDAVFSRCALIDVNQNRTWWVEMFEEIKRRSDFYGSIMREILEKNNFLELCEKYRKYYEATKTILIQKMKLEKRILNVYLPIITWFLFYNSVLLKKNFLKSEESEIWFKEIAKLIDMKMKEEKDQDIINDFFWVLNILYNQNKIYVSDWFVKVWDNTAQIAFSELYQIYNQEQIRQNGRIIKKLDLKKYMISEFGASESTMKLPQNRTCKSLRFNLEKLPDELSVLVENIKNDIDFWIKTI